MSVGNIKVKYNSADLTRNGDTVNVYYYNRYGKLIDRNLLSQGLTLRSGGSGVRLYGANGTSASASGYHVYGFSVYGDAATTGRNAICPIWPDDTYSN